MDSAKAMDKETEMLNGYKDLQAIVTLRDQRLKKQIILLGPSKC